MAILHESAMRIVEKARKPIHNVVGQEIYNFAKRHENMCGDGVPIITRVQQLGIFTVYDARNANVEKRERIISEKWFNKQNQRACKG